MLKKIKNFLKKKKEKRSKAFNPEEYFTEKSNGGVVLGKYDGNLLVEESNEPVCLIAYKEAGKNVSATVPTLLSHWKESTVIFDPEGDIYSSTSGARKEKLDNLILRFESGLSSSCSYNPLSEVRILSEHDIDDARVISEALLSEEKKPYFNHSARDVLDGIILYEAYKSFLKNPKFVMEFGIKRALSSATLKDVIEFIDSLGSGEEARKKIKEILQENFFERYAKDENIARQVHENLSNAYSEDAYAKGNEITERLHPRIAKSLQLALSFPPEVLDAVLKTLGYALEPFRKIENISGSDFRISYLANSERPVSLYLTGKKREDLVLSKILVSQALDILTSEMDFNDFTGHRHRLLVVLDDFPSLGRINFLEEGIKYFSGYGIKIFAALNSLKDYFNVYRDDSLLCGFKTQIFFTAGDAETAEYASKAFGKVQKHHHFWDSKIVHHEKEYFSKDDLLNLPSDKAVIKVFGKEPAVIDKFVPDEKYAALESIPYIYSESLADSRRQYIRLTEKQKAESGCPYTYMPYPGAFKEMAKDVESKEKENGSEKEKEFVRRKQIDAYNVFKKVSEYFMNE